MAENKKNSKSEYNRKKKALNALKEMERFDKLISNADDEDIPSGPPMSPLTSSFFTCRAFFDACVGVDKETLETVITAVGSAFGMHDELVRVR